MKNDEVMKVLSFIYKRFTKILTSSQIAYIYKS
jgi:hypothetical protein